MINTRITLTMIVIFAVAINTKAQKEADPSQIAAYQTKTMIATLDLQDKQVDSIKAINQKYAQTITQILLKESNFFGRMKSIRKNNNLKNEELEKVLSKKQMEKYKDEVQPAIRKYIKQQRKVQH
ncbi:hypothetical protein U6A24_16140 [Aquimarina gracilis]|uniref:DUF4168 domain-containing protein n=1 Tax=Aquimarina gracilis TaxID=874422 RepID=A0ABU5ZYT0_9FLAO|nr:hypothetical protein [Aquimarina gracilis]MEB3347006.1 hypothetical protein [Aquimarina gracilis]